MPQFTATSSIYWDGLLSLTISAFKHSAKLNWIKKNNLWTLVRFMCSASLCPSFIISSAILWADCSRFPLLQVKKMTKTRKVSSCVSQVMLVYYSGHSGSCFHLFSCFLSLHICICILIDVQQQQWNICSQAFCPWVCPYLLVPGGPSWFSLRLCGHSQQVLLTLVMVIRTKQIIGLKLCSCFLLLPAAAACPLIASLLSWDQCAHTHLTQTHTRLQTRISTTCAVIHDFVV